jgi:3-dehydroquinate synthase
VDAARCVPVALGDRSYTVHIEPGCLRELGSVLARVVDAERAVVVTSERVGALYGAVVTESLARAGLGSSTIVVPDGDRAKSLAQLSDIFDRLVACGADRDTFLVAVGGGAVGDLAGLAAATYLRGVPWVQVPTTLLAQADASVGGKTAVNHPAGKNLIGAFHQPRLVWIDPRVLRTLPARELRSGMAEVVKSAVIWDPQMFAWLEVHAERVPALDTDAVAHALERAVAVKAEIVGRDEREGGIRALLNFGHTLGHAIEAASGFGEVLHGEAISLGMVFAARRSRRIGLPARDVDRIVSLLERLGLPVVLADTPAQWCAYRRALAHDKKRRDGLFWMVLLREIGRAELSPCTLDEMLEGRTAA